MSKSMEISEFPLWDKLRNNHVPLTFSIELTARCNFNCRHCYVNLPAADTEAGAHELTLEEIRRIAEEALQLGAVWCLVTGGEPLLRKDFPEIYLMLKRMGFLVSVYTNAALVTPEHAALFKKYPPRDIEITVYGASKETFEKITRRPGSFDAFRKGLDLLIANGVKVRLKSMIMRSNIHEFKEISVFCKERTKDFYRVDCYLNLRNDLDPARNADIRAERLSPEEIIAIDRMAKKYVPPSPDEEPTGSPDNEIFGQHQLIRCGAGKETFYVSFDGQARLCSCLCRDDLVYDLRQGKLTDAWQDFIPRVRDMRSNNPVYLENCDKCEISGYCHWCPARALLETGKLDNPVDYFCRVAHAIWTSQQKDSATM